MRILRKPPPRKQQYEPGFAWNSTTQEFIPILPQDHPDYRQNQAIITEAIDRWNAGTSSRGNRRCLNVI
jgi:hypothetical protein